MSVKVILSTQRIGDMEDVSVTIIPDSFSPNHVEFKVNVKGKETVYFYVDKDDLKQVVKMVCKGR